MHHAHYWMLAYYRIFLGVLSLERIVSMRVRLKPLGLAWMLGCFTALVFSFRVASSQDSEPVACGNVGNINVTPDDQTSSLRQSHGFYLDVTNPAACSGSVSLWQFCYYRPSNFSMDGYLATFAVYSRSGVSNIRYSKISPTLEIFVTHNRIITTQELLCTMVELDEINIEEGSVLGVCITDPQGNGTLDLVGEVKNDTMELWTMSDGDCSDDLPSSVRRGDFSTEMSVVLHLTGAITSVTDGVITTTAMTFQTTEQPSQTETTQGSSLASTGLGAGAIVGIVIVVLLLLVAAVVSVVIVVIFVWRRKHYKSVNPNTDPNKKRLKNDDNILVATQTADTNSYEASAYEIPSESLMKTTSTVLSDAPTKKPVPEYSTLEESSPYEEVQSITPVNSATQEKTSAHIYAQLLQKNRAEDIYSDLSPYQKPSNKQLELYAQIKSCGIVNIPRNEIELTSHLGSGQFGSVKRGVWKKENQTQIDVALKTLNKGSSKEDEVKFLQEAAIMAQFRHPNVVILFGVITEGEPIMFVVELVHKGDLGNHLVSLKPDPGQIPADDLPRRLLEFSQHVALGMQYLAGKGFIHRDLAARNILVCKSNICKVADFGMSRDLADENYYISRGGKIPVKWTAPEAINFKKYSAASDVWSYGCLLYEIWSLGQKPFDGMRNIEVLNLVESGRRLPPPPGCPKMIYELMILCWHPDTAQRPSFRDLVLALVGGEKVVLSIPSNSVELAGALAAPIETSERLYLDLQIKYLPPDSQFESYYETCHF